eukprot:gnl/Ergobibamus_cyprinoides/1067.p1 GENE.gnl/Ergobibamus_cyprinoides/1067~~gnl/Ergobibamus_cyprinoides/1067.p1  ORF type:complete len:220 (-),score=46.69 gnl/Ergobibamus_cyprinoides/1067:435-1094(-)
MPPVPFSLVYSLTIRAGEAALCSLSATDASSAETGVSSLVSALIAQMIAGDDIDTAALPQTPLSSHPSFDAISAFLTHVLARAALYVASPSTLEAALSATSLSPGVVSAIKATYAKAGKALALKARASASTALPLLPASVPALTTVTAETSIVVSHSDMAKAREPARCSWPWAPRLLLFGAGHVQGRGSPAARRPQWRPAGVHGHAHQHGLVSEHQLTS